jgi:hypothetical protein
LVEKAASGVSSPDTRSNLIARLATTLAESGLSELAEEAAEVVVGAEQRARALATVAGLCTDEVDRADGLAEAAIHTALGIVDATARSAVLARLTTVFAEAHLWDRAEGAAGEIVQPATQKRALLSVINRLVEAIRQRSGPESDGAEDRLLRLGAVILSGADPVGLLTPLAAVHPRLVLDACDAMLPLVLGSPQQP